MNPLRVTAALLLVVLASCASGPNHLSRTVDDWQNQHYAENPFMAGVMTDVLPAYPLAKLIAFIPDWLVLNPSQFWGIDLWRAKGATFEHENPETLRAPWFADEYDDEEAD